MGAADSAAEITRLGETPDVPHHIIKDVIFNGRGHPLPKSRSRIKAGDLVLAIDDDEIGWFEALVIGAANGTYILHWRDYPEDGEFERRAEQIALMHDPRSR